MKEKVKRLWRLCFKDNEEFIDLYFRLRYNSNINIAVQSGDEVIAALQMIPYPMFFCGKEINTAYISGACTHPDYRNKGVMRQLLSQAFTQMLHQDTALSTLIPAEPWLFNYYARCGYTTVFGASKATYTLSTKPFPPNTTFLSTTDYQERHCDYLNRKLKGYPSSILHPKKDYQVILADLQLSKGKVYSLTQKGSTVALAFAYPTEENGWYIEEIVANSTVLKEALLQHIALQTKVHTLEVFTSANSGEASHPLGMARIINAKEMLQLYAATHPEVEMNIALSDELLSSNSAYYYLNNGRCMVSSQRLPGNHQKLTIGELTEILFADSHPHISLMLN